MLLEAPIDHSIHVPSSSGPKHLAALILFRTPPCRQSYHLPMMRPEPMPATISPPATPTRVHPRSRAISSAARLRKRYQRDPDSSDFYAAKHNLAA